MSKSRFLVCVSACCLLLACGNTGSAPQDYGSLLESVTDGVIVPEHAAFARQSGRLATALETLVDSPDEASAASAREEWYAARAAFRMLDALHFGPGYTQHISERIDAGPVDAAGIEAIVTSTGNVDDAAVSNAGGQKKGFLGLEYLLFPGYGSSHPAPVLAEDESAARRRELARSMAHEIAKSAGRLDAEWQTYAEQIKLAGAGGTVYATQRAAVDDLVSGCGYALELVVGVRLAQPLGRKSGGTPAPELDPTLRSDSAALDMTNSLLGVQRLYEGEGFSAVVRAKSAELDRVVTAELADGLSKVQALPVPFGDAVVNQTSDVQAAFDSTSGLKKTWNTDLSSALGATVRPSDNDGD